MNKSLKTIIIFLVIIVIVLLAWIGYPYIKNLFAKKELIFNINNNVIEVKIGGNEKINYEINEEIEIKWESENNEVVKVNNGIITGIGYGSTKVYGTVTRDEETITRECVVTTYTGEKNNLLSEIIVPDGELFITNGEEYKLEYSYNPENPYVTSIEYSSNDENIVSYVDGIIKTNNVGTSDVTLTINKNITKTIRVNVVEKKITPTFTNKIEEVIVETTEITMKPSETKEITYKINPEDGFVESVEWESNNKAVAEVNEGIVTAKSSGEAIITLTVNNKISKEIKIDVSVPVSGISINSNPKLVMKIGQKETIKTSVSPSNASNKKIKYTNSNPSSASVDENGNIVALKEGKGTVTVATVDGNYQVTVTYTVNPKTGLVSNTGDVWGYTSPLDKVPERADEAFFRNLASKGKGTLSNGVYIYSSGTTTYKYDIAKSSLNGNNVTVLTRFYYPPNTDLSTVNTFTFCNGTGTAAKGFAGILRALDEDHTKMKSSGIIILIASTDGKGYNKNGIILATEFVKAIVEQKSGVKNAVGAYSGSGEAVGYAGRDGSYDRLVIFNSYIHFAADTPLKDKEMIIYSPNGDKLQDATKTTINSMILRGFSNITIISNNSSIVNNSKYQSNALILNPGSQMGSGHGYANIPPTNVFSYACR